MKEQVIIIGAGPAGLGIAGRLRKANIPFQIIEQSDCIASSWTQHYDRLHLHTVKRYSSLPHLPFPEDFPTFVSRDELISYLNQYAEHFDIKPVFNQTVKGIRKSESRWVVTTQNQEYVAQNVVLATGVNRVPFKPHWDGMDSYPGQVIHSRDYKNPNPYKSKEVLVIGMGNTGAEIALDLCEHGVKTYISVRGPVNIVPLKILGRPTQETALKLAKLPDWISDRIANTMQKITIGDLTKYGIKTPKIAPSAQLRIHGKTPVIDLGTTRKIKQNKIKVMPDIECFESNKIRFKNGTTLNPHAVILATGYRSMVTDFINDIEPFLDKFGNPKHPVAGGELKGLYFLGFDNFRPGGILGVIYKDSKLILEAIKAG